VKNYLKILLLAGLVVLNVHDILAQNLIVNPSAETGPPSLAGGGWTAVNIGTTGTTCFNASGWRIIQSLNGYPAAQSGHYFFMPGCSSVSGTSYELRQDINVSLNAGVIDAGYNAFTFSGYMQVFNQTPTDQSQMIVEYRNAANTAVLTSYNTGLQTNKGVWTNYFKTTTAPAGTRWIRIRLIGVVHNGPSIDTYFDNLSLTTNIALPIVLTDFNAVPQNSIVKLTWTTSSETGNSFYTVQRSTNGTTWEDLEKINGSGTSVTTLNYTAYDNAPADGLSYYRIKQTDFSGTSTYSEIKFVDFSKKFTDVSIYPNPANTIFSVEGDNVTNAQISIYNSIGQLMNLPVLNKDKKITFGVSGIAKGIYFVRISNGTSTVIKKIILQ
jgi:hypothetical protein